MTMRILQGLASYVGHLMGQPPAQPAPQVKAEVQPDQQPDIFCHCQYCSEARRLGRIKPRKDNDNDGPPVTKT